MYNQLKTYSFLVVFFIILQFDAKSQFTVLATGIEQDLYCVHFTGINTGYAGGEEGVLIKTEDAGNSWYVLKVDANDNINDIWFIDKQHGFVVGENNVFLETQDGGHTWQAVNGLDDADYTGVCFTDSVTGYAIGHNMNGGLFYKTTDRGSTWSKKEINQDCSGSGITPGIDCNDIYLTNLSFLDSNHGLIAGFTYNYSYGKQPFICKTSDGGHTFEDISPVDKDPDWYNGKEVVSINYMNDNDACAIMNTGHGTDFMFISDYRVNTFEKNQLPSNFSSRGRFFSSEFLGRFIGYFAGIIEGNSQIIKTIDQGNSFIYLNPPTNKTIYASHFVDINNGYFAGEEGLVIHLDDRNNIVYSNSDQKGNYYDPPYSIASLKRRNKIMQVHIYNLNANDPKNFSIKIYDSQGNSLAYKPKRVKIYSDEIRMKLKIEGIGRQTYFYTVSYNNTAVVNGKLSLSSFAQNNY